MELKGRTINKGKVKGEVLFSKEPISFYGGVDPDTGEITDKESDINGQSVTGRILVFPYGKGSTVAPYTIYQLAKNGKAPKAMINKECETIVAVGCIISDIPCVDRINIEKLKSGTQVEVDADGGVVKVL